MHACSCNNNNYGGGPKFEREHMLPGKNWKEKRHGGNNENAVLVTELKIINVIRNCLCLICLEDFAMDW